MSIKLREQPDGSSCTHMQVPSLSTQSSLRLPSPSDGGPPMPLLVQLSPHEELSFEQSGGRLRGWGIFRFAEMLNGRDAKWLRGLEKQNHKTHAQDGTVIILNWV